MLADHGAQFSRDHQMFRMLCQLAVLTSIQNGVQLVLY